MAETIGYPRYTLGPRIPITVGASPFVLTNPLDVPGVVFIAGGTVSLIEFSRDLVNIDDTGMTKGPIRLNPGDTIRVTYSAAPTMVAYPF